MALRSPLTVQPYDYISDSTGRPLDYGQIYIGVANQDPEFYQIPVYLDAAMTKPIDQPIRTNDGFVDFAGSLSELYASGEIYSVKILDKEGRTVLYKGDMTRKNLMSDALADLNQSIVDAQSAAQAAIDDAINTANAAIDLTESNATTAIINTSDTATQAINNATVISNKAAADASSAIQELFENGGLPATPFETKTLMTASSLVNGAYAVVTNDVTANLGIYLKKSGSWSLVPWNNFVNLNSLKINIGKDYPLKNMTRNNVQTYISPTTKNWLLGAVVENAVEDNVYTIDYYQNGNTQLSGGGNGWIIKRHPKSTFATADNGVAIISYADSNTPLVRSGIQTLKLKSRRSSELFDLTIDTDALPAYGTAVNQTALNYPGYSAIIDESSYRYAKSINNKDMTCEVLVDKTTLIEFAGNEGYRIRITIGINGVNSLPNIKKVERKNAYGDAWSVVNESTSDWLPPMVVKALSNNDGSTYVKYTGGNHASSGGAEGDPTAVNKVFDILIDGMPINLEGINRQTKCSSVQIIIKNGVYAYNTTSLARAVVDQNFVLNIKPNVIAVSASITALENVTVFRDNGLQAIVNGYITTQLYLDGKTKSRENYSTANNGGTKVTAPNVWALILQSASTRQQLTLSFDRSYGLGDNSQVDDTSPLLFCGGSATQKAYGAIIKSTSGYTLNIDQSYKYRGAYSFDNTTTTANLDSIFTLPDGKCAVTNAYNYCK